MKTVDAALENLRNGDGLVDGLAHGTEDDGAVAFFIEESGGVGDVVACLAGGGDQNFILFVLVFGAFLSHTGVVFHRERLVEGWVCGETKQGGGVRGKIAGGGGVRGGENQRLGWYRGPRFVHTIKILSLIGTDQKGSLCWEKHAGMIAKWVWEVKISATHLGYEMRRSQGGDG